MGRSFCEMFLSRSSPRLPLSPDFVSNLSENNISEGPITLSTKRGHSWRLEIKKINDTYYFADGWNNVVADMQLRFGDYLYFQTLDQSTIKLSIFKPKDCDRFLAPKRFPRGFAELVGIDAEGTMTVKNLGGKEWVMSLRLDKSFRRTRRYYLSTGWARFRKENDLSEGDECVFRFVKSEGKLLLAKVTKKVKELILIED